MFSVVIKSTTMHSCKTEVITARPFFQHSAVKSHLIRTIKYPHKHKHVTLRPIRIPLIILSNKSAVETHAPWSDWHSVTPAMPANNMVSKNERLTSMCFY